MVTLRMDVSAVNSLLTPDRSGDFEDGKSGAVKVLGNLGFTVEPRNDHG